MNIVSIMAHQDDEMRCLGTMLKCRARGDKLAFVTVTDGSAGFIQEPDISREKAARIRHEEMTALARAVDAEYINLGERDEFLYDTPEIRMAVIEALRENKSRHSFYALPQRLQRRSYNCFFACPPLRDACVYANAQD